MKVYLDDERQTPPGWIRAYWPEEVIDMLQSGDVEEVSLDHDLGDDDHGTGYDVIKWIEEQVFLHDFVPPEMNVHSANNSAAAKMWAGIESIERMHQRNLRQTESRGRIMKITKRQLKRLVEQAQDWDSSGVDYVRNALNQPGAVSGRPFIQTASSAIADALMFDDFDPGREEALQEAIYEAANAWYAEHRRLQDERRGSAY